MVAIGPRVSPCWCLYRHVIHRYLLSTRTRPSDGLDPAPPLRCTSPPTIRPCRAGPGRTGAAVRPFGCFRCVRIAAAAGNRSAPCGLDALADDRQGAPSSPSTLSQYDREPCVRASHLPQSALEMRGLFTRVIAFARAEPVRPRGRARPSTLIAEPVLAPQRAAREARARRCCGRFGALDCCRRPVSPMRERRIHPIWMTRPPAPFGEH